MLAHPAASVFAEVLVTALNRGARLPLPRGLAFLEARADPQPRKPHRWWWAGGSTPPPRPSRPALRAALFLRDELRGFFFPRDTVVLSEVLPGPLRLGAQRPQEAPHFPCCFCLARLPVDRLHVWSMECLTTLPFFLLSDHAFYFFRWLLSALCFH